jgi:hypothetical protein
VLTAVNPTIVYDSSRPTLKKKETKVTRTVPSRPLLVWTLAAVKQDDSTLHPQKEQLQVFFLIGCFSFLMDCVLFYRLS